MKQKFTMLLSLIISILMLFPGNTVKAENGVDKTELEASINNAKAVDKNLYTDESLSVLDEKLASAETVFADEAATQEQVDDAKFNLDNAIDGLIEIPVDKSELEVSINNAKAVDRTLYTDESLSVLDEKLATAETVFADEAATQEQVDAAKLELDNAIDDLIEIPVDKTELEASINNAKTVNRTLYTDESLSVLDEKLATAETVFADEAATQEQVDDAKFDLDNAIGGLTEIPVDKTGLGTSINNAKAVNRTLYTDESLSVLDEKLATAETVFADEAATQEQVDDAKFDLDNAIGGLTEIPVDKTELGTSINNAKAVNRTLYTDESLSVLDEKLATAETVFADEAATQEQVDNAKLELDNAITGLIEKPEPEPEPKPEPEPEPEPKPVVNKESLLSSITYAKTINLSLYSETSAAAVNIALIVAETVLADESATQKQVDNADIALRISINNLKSYKISLEIKPDLDKISSRSKVNVLVSFSNLGTEDIAELILTDNLGLYRNVGSVRAADSKIYNLSYIMPSEFQSDSYTLNISAIANYSDGVTNSASKSVDFQVTALSADELDQVREPQLAQNVEKDEPVTKHNLELPKTGEHNYYYVSLALILILGILIRKRLLARD